MSENIEVFEFNSIGEAEAEYFRRRQLGCWQMVSALKIKWSWKKMRNVVTFSMKKVDKAYHIDDYMRDINKAISYGIETFISVSKTMQEHKKRKLQEKLNNPSHKLI